MDLFYHGTDKLLIPPVQPPAGWMRERNVLEFEADPDGIYLTNDREYATCFGRYILVIDVDVLVGTYGPRCLTYVRDAPYGGEEWVVPRQYPIPAAAVVGVIVP